MRLTIAALLWAIVLLFLCAILGGAGHGLVFPMAVTCAPFPMGYGPSLGLLAMPLSIGFWCFAARSAVRSKLWVCPTLLALHYALAVVALGAILPEDLTSVRTRWWLAVWITTYLAGQTALWWVWASRLRRRNGDYHKRAPWHPRSKSKPIAKHRSPKRVKA